jgi:hypothetical protein
MVGLAAGPLAHFQNESCLEFRWKIAFPPMSNEDQ